MAIVFDHTIPRGDLRELLSDTSRISEWHPYMKDPWEVPGGYTYIFHNPFTLTEGRVTHSVWQQLERSPTRVVYSVSPEEQYGFDFYVRNWVIFEFTDSELRVQRDITLKPNRARDSRTDDERILMFQGIASLLVQNLEALPPQE